MQETFIDNGLGCAAVLPSLNPTEKLDAVVAGLIEQGFSCIVLVDDGSDAEHKAPFERAEALPQCTVLRHPENRGKGAGLKTAFRYLMEERPDISSAVTLDGDGQHLPKDVLRCAQALKGQPDSLILGVRDFSLPDVPPRSRAGNRLTSFVFLTGCGIRISDTQTGLRAAPAKLFPLLLDIGGDRYEYETNMLLEFHRAGVPIREVTIETVYEDNNSGSHFRVVRDSVRIYGLILKYIASSLASAGVDLLGFWLCHLLLASALGVYAEAVCTVIARVVSSFFNFNVNRKLVFGSDDDYAGTMLRYYILCVIQMCVSAGGLSLIKLALFTAAGSGALTLIKLVLDTLLFLISFRIQRAWVFKKK